MGYRWWTVGAVCLVVGLGCMVVGGCGKTAFKVVPVSGKVTLDGKGVPKLNVGFQPLRTGQESPEAGTGSAGQTNDEGVYELTLSDTSRQKGAVVGKHQVTISRVLPPSQSDMGSRAPSDPVLDPIIAQILQSPKQFEVPAGGTKEANIELRQ